jgi:hypothetical protein
VRRFILEVPVECGVVTGARMIFIGTLNAPVGPFVTLLLVNIEPPKAGKARRARNGIQKRIWAGLGEEERAYLEIQTCLVWQSSPKEDSECAERDR